MITNLARVDYYTFGDSTDTGFDEDDATVVLSTLPPTGPIGILPLAVTAVLALLAGTAMLVIRRRRAHEPPATL